LVNGQKEKKPLDQLYTLTPGDVRAAKNSKSWR